MECSIVECAVFFLLQLIWLRRFYLAGDMTNLYSFIQGSLEWSSSELLSDESSWNQYKYIVFNNSLCRILIISYKTLIITGIYNETRSKLTIYANIMSKRHNILMTSTTIPYKIFGTKHANPVKSDRTGKVWYLLFRIFNRYCQSVISGRETGH